MHCLVQSKIVELEDLLVQKKIKSGVAVTYHYVIDDMIKNAL